MNRSEANEIVKKREEFSTGYDCFSLKDENVDPSFNRNGCECCQGLACSTFEVVCLDPEDIKNKIFDNIYELDICNGCLISLIYGDNSDLDFSVTNEDVAV